MAKKVQASFNSLTDDIVVQTLHYCAPKAILRFAATCRRYLHLVDNSSSLQLFMELEANGLEIVDGSLKGNATSSSILKELKQYRNAWLDLDLDSPIERTIDEEHALWHFREGIYAIALSRSGSTWTQDSIQFIPLNSSNTPPPVYFETEFRDFSFDMEQDLVVLARLSGAGFNNPGPTSAHIHLHSMTTGLPHPGARHSTLTVDFGSPFGRNEYFRFFIEIMGRILTTKFAHDVNDFGISEIWVWDWLTGAFLHKIDCYPFIHTFRFLDSKHLVVSSATRGEAKLHIYNISNSPLDPEVSPDGYFYSPSHPTIHPTLVLEFPPLQESHTIFARGFSLVSDRTPGRARNTGFAALACSRATTLGLRLILQRQLRSTGPMDSILFRVFVSVNKLLDYVEQYGPNSTTTLPWNDWGEHTTRWFVEHLRPYTPDHWLSESRYVVASLTRGSEGGREYVSVVDFHTPTIRRFRDRVSDSYFTMPLSEVDDAQEKKLVLEGEKLISCPPLAVQEHMEALQESAVSLNKMVYVETIDENTPTIISSWFKYPVTSRLPYRVVSKLLKVPACFDWLIDGNYIIGSEDSVHNIAVRKFSTYKLGAPVEG